MSLNVDRKLRYYVCGQCKTKIFYPITEDEPNPCPDCGWTHVARDKYDIPEEIKYPIN